MDTLTQIALGACIGQAIGYKKFGAKAMVFGGLGGLIPDLDVLLTPFMGEYGSWKYHRHFTHALWFGPVLGTLMGWGLWRYYGRQIGHLWPWIAVMVLAILTHPLLDFCTIYGTQLLAPFSNARFEIAAVSIIDPIYTLPLIAVMVLVAFKKFRPFAEKMAMGALIFTTAFLMFGWYLNFRAEDLAAAQLKEQQIKYKELEGFTTIFQPFLRRIVVTEEGRVRVGFISTFNPQKIHWTCRKDIDADVQAAILATHDAQMLKWFAGDRLSFTTGQNPNEFVVSDLRYGIEGQSIFGWWGQIFKVTEDANGKLIADYIAPLRIERNTDGQAIINLFRAAYGMDNTLLNSEDKGCSVPSDSFVEKSERDFKTAKSKIEEHEEIALYTQNSSVQSQAVLRRVAQEIFTNNELEQALKNKHILGDKRQYLLDELMLRYMLSRRFDDLADLFKREKSNDIFNAIKPYVETLSQNSKDGRALLEIAKFMYNNEVHSGYTFEPDLRYSPASFIEFYPCSEDCQKLRDRDEAYLPPMDIFQHVLKKYPNHQDITPETLHYLVQCYEGMHSSFRCLWSDQEDQYENNSPEWFKRLHKDYPNSVWAQKTPRYY